MRILTAIFLLAFPCMVWAAQSATETDKELLLLLQSEAEKIQSISSEFTQEKHLAMFDEILISTGYFAFKKPASLRWEYTVPFKAGFLLKDGEGTEWDDASDTQKAFTLQSNPAMSMVAKQIMAWTTFDIQWLQSRYEIKQISTSPAVLELIPRGEIAKEFLAHLIVRFGPDNASLSSLELHEIDGDFTRIVFTAPRINTALPNETFTSVQ